MIKIMWLLKFENNVICRNYVKMKIFELTYTPPSVKKKNLNNMYNI